jgi:hypothetical protein
MFCQENVFYGAESKVFKNLATSVTHPRCSQSNRSVTVSTFILYFYSISKVCIFHLMWWTLTGLAHFRTSKMYSPQTK